MAQVGIKETKEALVGLLKLSQLLAASFKDGVQAEDFGVILAKVMADEQLKQSLLDAYNGIDQVPAEISNLQLGEGIELLQAALPEVMNLIQSLRK